ncbi:NAD(P)-binding protein [Exiguobacterium artemiae]
MEQQKRIGIIGGGLAGVFAARQLMTEGYAVEIIEKAKVSGDGWQRDGLTRGQRIMEPSSLRSGRTSWRRKSTSGSSKA